MKEGRRYEGQSNSQEFSTTYFTEYGVLIEKEARKIISIGEVYEAKSTLELLASDSSRYKAELYWRISLPISALLLVFLAIPLSVINPRSGRSVNIIMALLLFVIYNNLLGVSHSIVSIGNTKIWYGLWPVHLFFATIAFYLLYRRTSNLPLLPKIIYKIK
jgi:lipopolysaccharide export system permease protein